ncbi:MAG: DUF2911 domain-containing protein [Vicinamibacterales bacterium]
MQHTLMCAAFIAGVLSAVERPSAQEPQAPAQELNSHGQVRVSPRVTVNGEVDQVHIRLEYGSPFARGRVIWGGIRPWDEWWMPGADEATTIETSAPLLIGTIAVPAGTHSIYTVPGRERFLLTINRRTGQFHTQYTPAMDLGRTEMTLRMLDTKVEQLTFAVEPSAGGGAGGRLSLSWDDREYSVAVTTPKH